MKGLLHSKRFRKNLYKWLFMYAGVMLLLTTVVTYSKYMTSQTLGDESRVTKFNVKINYGDDKCQVGEICETKQFRPTERMDYYFIVDTSELEVYTELVLRISLINEKYKIVSLSDVTDNEEGRTVEFASSTTNNDNKKETFSIWSDLDSKVKEKKYKVTVELNCENEENKECPNITSEEMKELSKTENMLSVGYSAIQVAKDHSQRNE